MRKSFILFVSIVFCFLSLKVNSQEVVSETIIRQGVKLFDEGKYQEAIDFYRQVNENDSNYVWMLSELSMTFYQLQKYDSAIYYAEKGLQFPSANRQHLMRTEGSAYLGAGNTEKSIEIYNEAINLYPYSYLLHYNQGMTYLSINDYQSAMKCFQEAIKCNPYHASSHMRLGLLMARQGNYTRALLSLETFLALEPASSRSNAILVYVENLCTDYVDTTYGALIEPFTENDLLQDLDGLIESKIVLNDQYKSAIKFSANLVKQTSLMLEKLPYDAETDDFWAKTYFPFFKAINEGNYIEPFLYTILESSDKDPVTKWLEKNKKTLTTFYKTGSYLNNIRRTKDVSVEGKVLTLAAAYDDNGYLISLGNSDSSGSEQGLWQYFYTNGEMKATGIYKAGKKEGEWKYFTDSGLPESDEYYNNGVLNGEYISYHPTGKVNITATFSDGKVDGKVTWRNIFGMPVRTLMYKRDTLEGEAMTYYNSSEPKDKSTYHSNQLTGKNITWYPTGQEEIVSIYKSDLPDGEYYEYFPDGRVSVKGKYSEGKQEGEWIYWYSNGRKKLIQNFSEGNNTGILKSYYYNGMPEQESNFNSSGKKDGQEINYDYLGRKVLESEYIDGMIVKITSDFNNPDGHASFGSPDGNFSYRIYDFDGRLQSEGSYIKGKQEGEKKLYFNNGKLKQKLTYKNGEYNGEALTFHPNGQTMSECYYKDGLLEGEYFEYGLDGTVTQTGSYLNNNMNNYWYFYSDIGNIENVGYYLNGLLNGWYTSYSVDGKISIRDRITDGDVIREFQFDQKGNVINDVNFLETREYQVKSSSDIIESVGVIKGGSHDGPIKWYHPGGELSAEENIVANNPEGEYFQYFPDGKIMVKGRYENGNREGLWITNYDDGSKQIEKYYFNNMKDSIWSYYYQGGSLRMTETYFNDELNGECNQYAPNGDLMIKLFFTDDEITGYQYMKNGKLTDIIPMNAGNQTVVAWYDNGQKSYEQHYKDFEPDGVQVKYYPDGKVILRREYQNGMLDGKYESYYPDGTPEFACYCSKGLYEGELINYYKSGKVKENVQFLHDEMNGLRKRFDKEGNPLPVEQYWNGNFIGFVQ